jgi:hypothetical protein
MNQTSRKTPLKFNPSLGVDTLAVMMLYFVHFGYEVGHLD